MLVSISTIFRPLVARWASLTGLIGTVEKFNSVGFAISIKAKYYFYLLSLQKRQSSVSQSQERCFRDLVRVQGVK